MIDSGCKSVSSHHPFCHLLFPGELLALVLYRRLRIMKMIRNMITREYNNKNIKTFRL